MKPESLRPVCQLHLHTVLPSSTWISQTLNVTGCFTWPCSFDAQCLWSEVKWSEVAQSCPTLCDPMDCSLSGSPSMGFSRQECWSGLPFPSPGDLPNPGIEPGSPTLQADALPSELPGKPLLSASTHMFLSSWSLTTGIFGNFYLLFISKYSSTLYDCQDLSILRSFIFFLIFSQKKRHFVHLI